MKRAMLILVLLVIWGFGAPAFSSSPAHAEDQQLTNPNTPPSSEVHRVIETYGAADDGTDGDPGDAGDGYGMASDVGSGVFNTFGDSGVQWQEYLWLMLMQLQAELRP